MKDLGEHTRVGPGIRKREVDDFVLNVNKNPEVQQVHAQPLLQPFSSSAGVQVLTIASHHVLSLRAHRNCSRATGACRWTPGLRRFLPAFSIRNDSTLAAMQRSQSTPEAVRRWWPTRFFLLKIGSDPKVPRSGVDACHVEVAGARCCPAVQVAVHLHFALGASGRRLHSADLGGTYSTLTRNRWCSLIGPLMGVAGWPRGWTRRGTAGRHPR